MGEKQEKQQVSVEIVVPQIGEAVSELTLLEWLKKEGEPVAKGDVLFTVDADKSVVEVEAFEEGELETILVEEGAAVLPGQAVARLRRSGEEGREAAAPSGRRIPISPRARRLLRAKGVAPEELTGVRGSGPDGLITEKDAAAFLEAEAGRSKKTRPAAQRAAGERRIKQAGVTSLGRARKVIAAKMKASKREVPHFYLTAEVDMSAAQSLRQDCTSGRGWSRPPGYTALIVAACASALADMPEINVSYGEDALIRHETVGVGVAVDSQEGLVVPVLRDADRLSLREISERLQEFRSTGFRLKDSHFGEKSMVVSNLGTHGVDAFFPIIDMPDSLILGVGRIRDRVVALDGKPAVRPTVVLSLSVDHRVLDGAPAGRFLEAVAARLEDPGGLLGEEHD